MDVRLRRLRISAGLTDQLNEKRETKIKVCNGGREGSLEWKKKESNIQETERLSLGNKLHGYYCCIYILRCRQQKELVEFSPSQWMYIFFWFVFDYSKNKPIDRCSYPKGKQRNVAQHCKMYIARRIGSITFAIRCEWLLRRPAPRRPWLDWQTGPAFRWIHLFVFFIFVERKGQINWSAPWNEKKKSVIHYGKQTAFHGQK